MKLKINDWDLMFFEYKYTYGHILMGAPSIEGNERFIKREIDSLSESKKCEINEINLIKKISAKTVNLGDVCFLGRGEELSKKSDLICSEKIKNSIGFISGDNIKRYHLTQTSLYIEKQNIKKDISKLYSKNIKQE